MLGVYDYTVVLTYVSLMVSIGGMMFAVNGHLHLGVMCLAISPAFVICLMERLQEQKRTGQKWKSVSESRLIR